MVEQSTAPDLDVVTPSPAGRGAMTPKAATIAPLLDHDPTDDGSANYMINFGPQHPAAHGVLRLVMELDGEIIERVDPHIGLLHRGTEKLMRVQDLPPGAAVFRPARLRRPMCMEHSYVLAIEKLATSRCPSARSISASCSRRSRAFSTTSSTSRRTRWTSAR